MNRLRILLVIVLCNLSSVALSNILDEETYCLAQNMFFEARSESLEGQLMVAAVTINRANHKKFPNSICGVVWQKRQFSWTHDGKSDNPAKMGGIDRAQWFSIIQIAELILREPNHLLPKTDALFYHATYSKPIWRHKLTYIKTVGKHRFYK